ncbi:MAG: hypothetical protein AAFQ13_09280, partial [Pseudomonadota bacterium]
GSSLILEVRIGFPDRLPKNFAHKDPGTSLVFYLTAENFSLDLRQIDEVQGERSEVEITEDGIQVLIGKYVCNVVTERVGFLGFQTVSIDDLVDQVIG